MFGSGLSGVSCGPRAFGSGSPSIAQYLTKRQSCQPFYTITDMPRAWLEQESSLYAVSRRRSAIQNEAWAIAPATTRTSAADRAEFDPGR